MENLVIVESPGKTGTIQKFLGGDYSVKSSHGHIRDLQDKKLSIDVNDGFKPEYVVSPDKKQIVAELKKAASQARTVWLASDEDREGEAIAWHLAQTLELDPAKTRRIVFHEITKDAILEAVKNPRDIDMNLVNAQQARRVLDRLVGFELSPLLWRKIQRGLSAGRVQSVALKLVVEREKEINTFASEPYYKVEGNFDFGSGIIAKGILDERFPSLEEARKFLQDSIGDVYSVASMEQKEATRCPAPPFTTSTLQQEAARKLHFPVSTTMRIAQDLYERGLITYMRTDSLNLSSLAINTAKNLITDTFGGEYSHPRQFKTKTKGAQEAHEAIRPTYIDNTDIQGTAQEKKLYSLIWKRTVASQMAEARMLNTSIKLEQKKRSERYTVQSSKILFDGFLKVYLEGTDDELEADQTIEQNLPKVETGQLVNALEIKASGKFTQAPYRYSEATLIKKLEELGIGRPSTFATIINTLTKTRGYILKGDKEGRKVQVIDLTLRNGGISESQSIETIGAEKGKLLPQDLGIIVSDYLNENFEEIMDYDFTANVEEQFDKVASGKMDWTKQIAEFYAPFHSKVEDAAADRNFTHVERYIGDDPASGQKIVAKFGQYGPYVQKGEGDDKQFANLGKNQLIETLTLEEALKLFELPRTVGQYNGEDVIATKGKFGPYVKIGSRNLSIPRGMDPLKITLDQCVKLLEESENKTAANDILKEFPDADIAIINGRYGAYIKHAGSNYRIPKGTDAASLDLQACQTIIDSSNPTAKGKRRFFRKKK